MDNNFTKEEFEIIHLQLGSRRQDFNSLMIEAAKGGDQKRVIECAMYIDKLDKILNKCFKGISN